MLKCANNFRKSKHKGNLTLIILCSFSFNHNIYEPKYWLYNYPDSIHSQGLTIVIALFSLSLRPSIVHRYCRIDHKVAKYTSTKQY